MSLIEMVDVLDKAHNGPLCTLKDWNVRVLPKSIAAKPRRIIGGHIVGFLSGSLLALIPHSAALSSITVYALAVGLSILLMVALNVEHPPASGTALGTAITGFSPYAMIAIFTSSIILALAHHFLKRFLKDLI